MPFSNLILTGGINHDYEDASQALKEVLDQADIQSTMYCDIDQGLKALNDNSYDLVTMFTLRWRMLDDEKYIPFRDEWAYEIGQQDQGNLKRHITSGGGLLGLHTAAICFDTWSEWPALLGAKWVWGTTFHPPPEEFLITDINSNHPSTKGLEEFHVIDEIYHNIEPGPDSEALFSARSSEDKSLQTLAWAQQFEQGRVIYNALAHDRASIKTPGHAQFLQQAALWCCGEVQ